MPRLERILFVMACPPGIAAQSGDLAVPPAGMLTIAGYCRREYPHTRFMLRDFGAEKIPLDEQIREIKRIGPQIIGLAARTFIFPATIRLAREIKTALPEVKIVFGGHHPSLMPESQDYPDCFDTVVRGEGEAAFLELLKLFEAGRPWPRVFTGPYLDDLDHDYAWDIIEKPEAYVRSYSPFYPQAMGSVVWSRGCPFNCNFCSGPALWAGSRPRVRYRTPGSICNELGQLRDRFGITRFFVHDDTLNANLDRLKEILEEIIARRIKVIWSAAGMRANRNMTPEWLFPLMYKAGCRMISYGIESGSERILRKINRRVVLDECIRALELTKKYGMRPGAGFTMGHIWQEADGSLGGETEAELQITCDYIRDLSRQGLLWSTVIAIIDPVPGSELYHIAERNGLLLSEDYEDLLSYDRVRLGFRHPVLGPEVVEKYYLKSYRAVALNPQRMLWMFSYSRSLTDVYGLLRTGAFLLRSRLFGSLKQRFLNRAAQKGLKTGS